MSIWRFVLAEPGGAGEEIIDLTNAFDLEYSRDLLEGSTAGFSMYSADPDCQLIVPMGNDVLIYQDGRLRERLRIINAKRSGGGSSGASIRTFDCVGYKQLLDRRKIHVTDVAASSGFGGIDFEEAGWNLIGTAKTTAVSSGNALPAKVVGEYFPKYGSVQDLASIPTSVNLVYLFQAGPAAADASTYPSGSGKVVLLGEGGGATSWAMQPESWWKEQVATLRAKGTVIILSVGGAGAYVDLSTAAKAQACLDSIKQIYTQVGGFDGVDFNLETTENGYPVYPSNMVYIAQQLRSAYGQQFAFTVPAAQHVTAPYIQHDIDIVTALNAAGCLNFLAPQVYDGFVSMVESQKITLVQTVLNFWAPYVGNDWTKLGVGFRTSSPATSSTMSVASSYIAYDLLARQHPDIRGAFHFDAAYDGTHGWEWADTLSPRVKSTGSTAVTPAPVGLVDYFTDAAASATKWTFSGSAAVTGGYLSLNPTGYGSTPPNQIISTGSYSILDGSIQARIRTNPVYSAPNNEAWTAFELVNPADTTQSVTMRIFSNSTGTKLEVRRYSSATTFTSDFNLSFTAGVTTYFRFYFLNGYLILDVAPDAGGVPGTFKVVWLADNATEIPGDFLGAAKIRMRSDGSGSGVTWHSVGATSTPSSPGSTLPPGSSVSTPIVTYVTTYDAAYNIQRAGIGTGRVIAGVKYFEPGTTVRQALDNMSQSDATAGEDISWEWDIVTEGLDLVYYAWAVQRGVQQPQFIFDNRTNVTDFEEDFNASNFANVVVVQGDVGANQTYILNGGHSTGGTFYLAFNGYFSNGQGNSAFAYNVSLETFKQYLEAMPSIGSGNLEITGPENLNISPYKWTITFTGSLGKRPLPALSMQNSLTGGTGVGLSQSIAGSRYVAQLMSSDYDSSPYGVVEYYHYDQDLTDIAAVDEKAAYLLRVMNGYKPQISLTMLPPTEAEADADYDLGDYVVVDLRDQGYSIYREDLRVTGISYSPNEDGGGDAVAVTVQSPVPIDRTTTNLGLRVAATELAARKRAEALTKSRLKQLTTLRNRLLAVQKAEKTLRARKANLNKYYRTHGNKRIDKGREQKSLDSLDAQIKANDALQKKLNADIRKLK